MNKISFLIVFFIFNSCFINQAYSQSETSYVCYQPDDIVDDGNVRDAYNYITVGVGPVIFIPNIGIGHRERYSQFGWDTALSFSTIGYAHQVGTYFVGHYYLNQTQSSPYLGLGLMGSGIFTNRKDGAGTLSADFVFGKELKRSSRTRQFIEMHLAIPTVWIGSGHSHSMYFPLMYLKYGFSF